MHLVASVRPSVWVYPGHIIHHYAGAAKSNKSHYQCKVFVCVSVISGRMRIIARRRSIGVLIYIVGLLIWIVPLECECRNPFNICKRHSISSGECGDVRYSLSSGDIRHTCPYCRTIFSKAESLEEHQRNCGSDLIKKEFKGLETSC